MRIYVESFGCSTNIADGETLAGCLREAGYELTGSHSEADVVVYNCCSVKGPTENRMIALLQRVAADKKLIVVGCLPMTSFERLERDVRFDGVLGPAAGDLIVEMVKRVLAGERVVDLENASRSKPAYSFPRKRKSELISIVPVAYGCLGACSYCCVVFARGRLRSYSVEEVVERVKRDLACGAWEFWLTSQDVACYGRDIGIRLPALLERVCEASNDSFVVRVGMMTPNFVLDMLPQLVSSFKSPKVFKFLHLPLQSGDNGVLRTMNRCYSVKEFTEIVASFRSTFPEITLATDVICGFPGETKKAFENTLYLLNELKPDIVNFSKFFARPGTQAARLTQNRIDQNEIKQRTSEVAKLAKEISLERNQSWIGWEGMVLFDEKGKLPGTWIGRNFAYKPIVVSRSSTLLGKSMRVTISGATNTYLKGKLHC